ncbi:MAG: nucleotidyltransferase family protein [Lysobacterales bacterium]
MNDSPAASESGFGSAAPSSWIATVLAGRKPLPLAAATAEQIVDCAETQGVAALLYQQLAAHSTEGAASEVSRALAPLHARAIALEMLRREESRRVLSALAQADIPLLVLKGAALAQWAYPATYLRARDDLDLLFADRAAAERARQILLGLGYVGEAPAANGPQYELTMTRTQAVGPDWHVDVHWRMSPHPVFAECFGFSELLAASVALPEGGRGLGKVHALLHAAIHRVSNLLIGQGDRLVWLFDLHVIEPQLDADDWAQLASLAESRQLAGPLLAAMEASQRLLGTAWPPEFLASLQDWAESEVFKVDRAHLRGYFEWETLRKLPLGARMALVWRKLFPDTRYMYERYRLQHRWQLPMAYLRRWIQGLRILVAHRRQRPH